MVCCVVYRSCTVVRCVVLVMHSGVLCGICHVQWCVVWCLSFTVVCCVAEVMYIGVLCGIEVMRVCVGYAN